MMKLYKKKSVSVEDETVLVHLERRHTLKEDTNEADSVNLRKTVRANSLGGFEEGHSSTDIDDVPTEKQSSFTRRPTVITESELSSSWLYKDRKAKINSDDESVDDPKPTMPQEGHEDLEPRALQDPKLKPVPVPQQRPRKVSSCCWYFTIILVICIACLAVIAGVGGIVYMEYFAIYPEKDTENADASVKNDNLSASKEIFQQPTHKEENFYRNEPRIPEHFLKRLIKNSAKRTENTDISRKVAVTTPQPNDNIFPNKDLTDSQISKEKELSEIKISFVSENHPDIEMTEHPKTADVSRNIHGRFNHFNVPISDKSVEIKSNVKNQDSLDLNLNLQSEDDTMDKTRDRHVDEVNEQMRGNGGIVTEKSTLKADVLDSSQETLPRFNFNDMTELQDLELKDERLNPEMSFQNLEARLLHDKFLDHMENTINDNHEDDSLDLREHDISNDPKDNSVDLTEHSVDHSPDNSFDLTEQSIDHSPKNNSFDLFENNIDHSPDNSFDLIEHTIDHSPDNSFDLSEHPIDHSPKSNSFDLIEHSVDSKDKSLNDHSDESSDFDSNDSSSEETSLVNNQNQDPDDSAQLVFIRPIVESKAVPIPLAFLRRIGFDIKNADSHQPMTAEDMDIKFSLAEALKYLRSLDTESKLPVSREKTVTRKTNNPKESMKTKLPIKSEREEYLNLLRKHIFEESS